MSADAISYVGILEDDDDLRGFLVTIIKQTDGLEVAFAADCIEDAITQSKNKNLDICLVDLQLPDGNGLEFVEHIKKISDTKILILTILGDRKSVLVSLKAGTNGYLLKDTAPNQIRRDIIATLKGQSPISPQVATYLLQMFQPQQDTVEADNIEALTEREKDILNMFTRGLSYKETASALNISHHTVGDYVKSIYRKLSVNSRNEAIFEATQMGIINLLR